MARYRTYTVEFKRQVVEEHPGVTHEIRASISAA